MENRKQNDNLISHNEKRKAQDKSDVNVKDTADIKDLRDSQSSYEDYREV